MANTFTILDGELTESTRKSDIYSILQGIPNNAQKLISPRDVRDAFLTTWSNTAFKITTNKSGNEYIGVDSSNPIDLDIKKKMLFGKRSVGNFNIMTDSLLNNNNSDIFFYNTKLDKDENGDKISQNSTKLSFLAGEEPSLFYSAPFLESYIEEGENSIKLKIENPQDSINLLSIDNRVSINNISFPTVFETSIVENLEDKVLKYKGNFPYGKLVWDNKKVDTVSVGDEGSNVEIKGKTVNLNGYPLEFIEDMQVPDDVGGIKQGESFPEGSFPEGSTSGQNWPLVEVMRKLIYPEKEADLKFNVYNNKTNTYYLEAGVVNEIKIEAKLTSYAREKDERITKIMIGGALMDSPININDPFGTMSGEGFENPGDCVTLEIGGDVNNDDNSCFKYIGKNSVGDKIKTNQGIARGEYEFRLSYSKRPDKVLSGNVKKIKIEAISPIVYNFSNISQNDNTLDINGLNNKALSDFGTIDIDSLIDDDKTIKKLEKYPNKNNDDIKDILDKLTEEEKNLILTKLSSSVELEVDIKIEDINSNDSSAYIYFAYPSNNSSLLYIKDPNGNIVYNWESPLESQFEIVFDINSTNKGKYNILRTKNKIIYPNGGIFKFIFSDE